MSLGLRADPTNTSAVISVAGTDQVVITNASNVVATTFTGALAGNASTATGLSTSTGAAPVYGARAWVNFDGTRDTSGAVSTANTNRLIRAQGNVSSVLRNGTGDYTVNFTTALQDGNYSTVVSCTMDTSGSRTDAIGLQTNATAPTASAVRLLSQKSDGTDADQAFVCAVIFR